MPDKKRRVGSSDGENYKFFSHRECEAFPCHSVSDTENFNCLFCYCPLYVLGRDCGGTPAYLKNGVKDCSKCSRPHERENYDAIIGKFRDIVKKLKEFDGSENAP